MKLVVCDELVVLLQKLTYKKQSLLPQKLFRSLIRIKHNDFSTFVSGNVNHGFSGTKNGLEREILFFFTAGSKAFNGDFLIALLPLDQAPDRGITSLDTRCMQQFSQGLLGSCGGHGAQAVNACQRNAHSWAANRPSSSQATSCPW